MKKTFILDELECANCAAKIENGVKEIEGVESASVSFLTKKMIIEYNEERYDEILKKIKKIVKKYEPDVKIKQC